MKHKIDKYLPDSKLRLRTFRQTDSITTNRFPRRDKQGWTAGSEVWCSESVFGGGVWGVGGGAWGESVEGGC